MRHAVLLVGAVLIVSSARGATVVPEFLSTQVNPFGAPEIGTGIGIYAETSGTEPVTAQRWRVEGAIVNLDGPGTLAEILHDAPRVQHRGEALMADHESDEDALFSVNDSYWGSFFGDYPLGLGFDGSGGANPTGTDVANPTMTLQGGTTFGSLPASSELLLYLVITEPVVIVEGELAVGIEPPILSLPGEHVLDLQGNLYPASGFVLSSSAPEPSALCLIGIGWAVVFLRRWRR